MDKLELAKALLRTNVTRSSSQTTTAYGIAASDSSNGTVTVNLGGDTVSTDDDQTIEVATTFAVKEGDEVILSLVGADGTGKTATVIGVVGRGDETQSEIDAINNYFWTDAYGAHVSTEAGSVNGANVLLDSDSLDIRVGASNDESDQTVLASFGTAVTVGNRASGYTVGSYSQVYGYSCIASGDYSRAEGSATSAVQEYTHAEGQYTTAGNPNADEYTPEAYVGKCSHAEGYQTKAYGSYAHSEGYQTDAKSPYAHAEGFMSRGYNIAAHGEGAKTYAQGPSSHSEGCGTKTGENAYYQHVQGICNVEDENGTYADIVGNGHLKTPIFSGQPSYTSDLYQNAYNLDWSGNAEFQGEVYVGGCTPNGETPYPVVRYNTSSSQSEYYDSDSSAWTAISSGGGGGSSWTLLWTNADPDSNFAAQTVSLDLSSWNLICVLAKPQPSGSTTSVFLAAVGTDNILCCPNVGGTQYFYKRNMTVSTSGVEFSTGYRNTTGTSGTGYCIPCYIYGLA